MDQKHTSPERILREGIAALTKRLGPGGALFFVRQCRDVVGDYTAERAEIIGDLARNATLRRQANGTLRGRAELAEGPCSLHRESPHADLVPLEGASLELPVSHDHPAVRPSVRLYSLDALVDGIAAENHHEETARGPAAGREIW